MAWNLYFFYTESLGLAPLYLAGVSVLNIGFLWYAFRLLRENDERLPMQTFGYSIIYLMVLFAFLLSDHYLQMILN